MIITRRDIRALENFLDDFEKQHLERQHASEFFTLHPQLVMAPLGFDEYVALSPQNEKHFRQFWHTPELDPYQPLFRKPTGRWLMLEPIVHPRPGNTRLSSITFVTKQRSAPQEMIVEDLLSELERCVKDTVTGEKRLWTPRLWTPEAQERERIALANSVSAILRALRSEAVTVRDLTWTQLEEVVAEVLRSLGLEIHAVKERPQGGRDLIARGELIPGQEPLEMAVEIKHKPLVKRPEVQTALWQNRMYPALLFVTSGRFSAGVLQEKVLPENRLRLFLKDGEALGDLVYDYFSRELISNSAVRGNAKKAQPA